MFQVTNVPDLLTAHAKKVFFFVPFDLQTSIPPELPIQEDLILLTT